MPHNEGSFSNTLISRTGNNYKSFVSGKSNISRKYQFSKIQAKAEVEKNEQLSSRIMELQSQVFSLESERAAMERSLIKIQDELVEFKEREEDMKLEF